MCAFQKIYFHCVHVSVFSGCMHVLHMCAWCPGSSEEGSGFLGIGVRGGCEPPDVSWILVLWKSTCLTAEISFQVADNFYQLTFAILIWHFLWLSIFEFSNWVQNMRFWRTPINYISFSGFLDFCVVVYVSIALTVSSGFIWAAYSF